MESNQAQFCIYSANLAHGDYYNHLYTLKRRNCPLSCLYRRFWVPNAVLAVVSKLCCTVFATTSTKEPTAHFRQISPNQQCHTLLLRYLNVLSPQNAHITHPNQPVSNYHDLVYAMVLQSAI